MQCLSDGWITPTDPEPLSPSASTKHSHFIFCCSIIFGVSCLILPVLSSSNRCSSTTGGGAGAGIPFLPPTFARLCPKYTKLAFRRWPLTGWKWRAHPVRGCHGPEMWFFFNNMKVTLLYSVCLNRRVLICQWMSARIVTTLFVFRLSSSVCHRLGPPDRRLSRKLVESSWR